MQSLRLSISALLITVASLLLVGYKPGPPPATKKYADAKKTVELVISTSGYRVKSVKLNDKKRGKVYKWKSPQGLPAHLVIAAKAKRVAWIGGYGGPCANLGLITIFDFAGTVKKRIDLNKEIPKLKKISREFTKICCPCFWIHKAAVNKSGESLELNVCKKKRVTIDLKRLTVRVSKI